MTTDAGFEVDLWEFVPCAYCGADAGEPCHTANGIEARKSHAGRRAWVD